MRQAALLVVLVCLLAAPVVGATGVGSAPSQQAAQDETTLPEEGVEVTIQVQSDGAARWIVSTKYPLYDENDTAAFEDLREEFEAYETDSEFSVDVFRAVVPDVSERVGREMEIRNAERRSRIVDHGNNSTGVLSVRFTWMNFTRVENETLLVDSFTGSWFGDLSSGQTLTIRPPEGYDTDRVQPGPTAISDGAYVWEGPQQFSSGEPTAVFTAADDPFTGPVGVSMQVVVGIGLVALLLGAILVWAYYWEFPGDLSDEVPAVFEWFGGGEGAAQSDESTEGDGGRPAATATEESTATRAEADAEAGTGVGAGAAAGTTTDEDVDPELLSDEERVVRLLREHGGRMKQSKIVDETRWSTAKVSQLLSSMAEEDRVEKLRIGRENLISLPDEGLDEE